ncbi:MAG: VOC family protein [Acidobacteriia bacterium]|nr:VOC family protein [Terriglobia bacterium]
MIARFVLLICAASSALLLSGQKAAPAASVPAFGTEGAFWAIVVADLDASERWYSENLGFRRIKKSTAPNGAAETSVLEGHGIYVELVHFLDGKNTPLAQVGPKEGQRLGLGIFKTGVTVSQEVFDQLIPALRARNVQFVGGVFEDKEMAVRSFIVKDNTGNPIQFFARSGDRK